MLRGMTLDDWKAMSTASRFWFVVVMLLAVSVGAFALFTAAACRPAAIAAIVGPAGRGGSLSAFALPESPFFFRLPPPSLPPSWVPFFPPRAPPPFESERSIGSEWTWIPRPWRSSRPVCSKSSDQMK